MMGETEGIGRGTLFILVFLVEIENLAHLSGYLLMYTSQYSLPQAGYQCYVMG